MPDEKIEVVEAREVLPLAVVVKHVRTEMTRPLIEYDHTRARDALEDLIAAASALEVQHQIACQTIYQMHVAATGNPNQQPVLGLVEDVAYVRAQGNNAAKAARAAVDGWEAYEQQAEQRIKALREARDQAVQLIAKRLDPRTDTLLMKQLEVISKQGE